MHDTFTKVRANKIIQMKACIRIYCNTFVVCIRNRLVLYGDVVRIFDAFSLELFRNAETVSASVRISVLELQRSH